MRNPELLPYRQRALAHAIGSGLNLPHYPNAVTEVVGLDPSAPLAAMARRAARGQFTSLLCSASGTSGMNPVPPSTLMPSLPSIWRGSMRRTPELRVLSPSDGSPPPLSLSTKGLFSFASKRDLDLPVLGSMHLQKSHQ